MPSVSAVVLSGDYSTLTFTGSNFITSGYAVVASFDGFESSSATIDSAT